MQDMSQRAPAPQARQALRARKSDEAYQEWLRQLRDRAIVEYRLEEQVEAPLDRRSRPAHASRRPIAVTAGEPAGIGPDFARLAQQRRDAWWWSPTADLLAAARAQICELGAALRRFDPAAGAGRRVRRRSTVLHRPARAHRRSPVGWIPPTARYVLARWRPPCDGCLRRRVRTPWSPRRVHKGVINDAGIAFTGHTEFLADAHRDAARRDDAGRRRHARGARHHASRAGGCRARTSPATASS